MKKTVLTAGILLMLFVAGNGSLNAQRGNREDRDSLNMIRPGRDFGYRQMRGPGHHNDSLFMGKMHEGFAPGRMHGNMRNGVPGQKPDMRFGMRPEHFNRMEMRPDRNGRMRIESIPNLTDKQKSEIASLKKQHQDEMQKFRSEITSKMQVMREDHRKKLFGLLTDDQKKFLEQAPVRPAPVTPELK
jgi:hypothetical protein